MNAAPAQKYTQKELKNWPPASLFPLMANDFPVALDTPRKLGNIKNDLKQLTANEISQLVYPGETHARRRFKAPWEENRNVKVWRCKPVADMIKQSLSRKIWVSQDHLESLKTDNPIVPAVTDNGPATVTQGRMQASYS
eukprot:8630_1